MDKPTQSQIDAARRMVEREARGAQSAEERARAARALYESVEAHLGTLIGVGASRALFARSVKLAAPASPIFLRIHGAVSRGASLGDQLVVCLREETPDGASQAATDLFATFLALLGTLIGERLTAKILRDTFLPPSMTAPVEETK